jgi:hypothetical protein
MRDDLATADAGAVPGALVQARLTDLAAAFPAR